MKNKDDSRPYSSQEHQLGIDSDSPEATSRDEPRREPVFTDFDEEEDDSYEEADRDTDYASGYREDSIDDDEFDDTLLEEDENVNSPDQDEWPEFRPAESWDKRYQEAEEAREENDALWDESEPTEALQYTNTDTDTDTDTEAAAGWDGGAGAPEPRLMDLQDDDDDHAVEEDNSDWADEDDYPAEDTIPNQKWPLGLIAVAILALILLAGGGYGVIQQRAETQQQIQQLHAALATAVSPAEVTATRNELQTVKEQNAELQANAETMTLYNKRLTDTVAGLESQLKAQEEAMVKLAATPQPATPQPAATKPTPKPATPAPPKAKAKKTPVKPQLIAAPATPTKSKAVAPWFVNFASYGQQAIAQSWATKLKPVSGKVVVATSNKDGRTFYRVRIVQLDSREAAEKVARQLESKYGLSKLWIGKQ